MATNQTINSKTTDNIQPIHIEMKAKLTDGEKTLFGFFITLFSILIVIAILKSIEIIDHDNWNKVIYILMGITFVIQLLYNIVLLNNHEQESKGNVVLGSLGIVLIFLVMLAFIFQRDKKHVVFITLLVSAWMLYNIFMISTYVN